ncbi:MAG: acyl-CoA dehydrogenase family protein [Proteobacteria bacterium]|jgi:alkylation response protein AidB-like acyl-CoA dehydrogenase|nr:acyl-CoA dehydrogenase family protein [Pseudomonadota bacterium]
MDFSLTDDQRQLQEMARKFATTELVDLAKELEEKNIPVPSDWMKRYGELGFLGMNIATEYGGMGVGNIEALLVLEEFVKVSAAVAFPVFESSVGPVRAIEHFGTDALKERIIPAVCKGEKIVAVCMSEPAAGSALTDLKTRAVKGDNGYTVTGQKRWCSGGGHADGYVVYSRMSDAPGSKGIGAVFVEKGSKGLSFGEPEQLMGFRGVPSADIFFDDVEAPLENEIVPAGGFGKLMEAFDLERCGNATMCLGIAQSAFDYALEYSQEREQFGKPIIDFQAIQIKLADMAMKLEAARLLIHRAAQQANDGLPSVRDSSLAKCFSNEIGREVCGIALQVMGAYGYSKSYGMEQRLRDSWGWGIAGGTIDIQKVNIAATYAGRRFNQRS